MGKTRAGRKRRRGRRSVPPPAGVNPVPPPEDKEPTPIPDVISRVNYRLLGISVVVAVVLVICGWLIHGWQYQRNIEQLRELADQAEQEGDYGDAIRRLSKYLAAQRGTAAATDELLFETLTRLSGLHQKRAGYADVDEVSSDPLARLPVLRQLQPSDWADLQKAMLYNEEALRIDPDRDDTRLEVVRLGTALRRFSDTLEHIEVLPGPLGTSPGATSAAITDTIAAELQSTRARCFEGLSQLSDAQRAWINRIVLSSDDCEPYVALVRLITSRPDSLCTEDDFPEASSELARLLHSVFPRSSESSPDAALKTAVGILDLMTDFGRPGWDAHRQRAEVLTSLWTSQENSALSQSAAAEQSHDLLVALDEDQNGLLDRAESNHPTVPPFADGNRDGRIDEDELTACLTSSLSMNRLRQAELSINVALDVADSLNDPAAQMATRTTAVDVFLARAESEQYEHPERAQDYVQRAAAAATQAAALDQNSAESILLKARMHLQTVAFEPDPDLQQQRLDESESLLRSAYALIAPQGAEVPSDDSESRPLLNSVVSTLADVLLYQYERQPEERQDVLAEVKQGLIPLLESADASESMLRFLEGRVYFAARDWTSADDSFRRAAAEVVVEPNLLRRVMLMRVQCAARLGNPTARMEHSLAILQLQPRWGPARVAHAEAAAAAGQLDEAIRHYSAVGGRADHTPRLAQLLLIRESRKPFAERRWNAVQGTLRLLEEQPKNAVKLASLRSEFLYAQAVQAQEAHQAEGSQGISDVAREFLDQADQMLLDAVEANPDEVDLAVARISFLFRRFDTTAADRVDLCREQLAAAREQFGDDVRIRAAAVPVAVLLPEGESLSALLELSPSADEFTADESAALLKAIARTLAVTGEMDQALDSYLKASELAPHDVTIPVAALQLIMEQDQQQIVDGSSNWEAMRSRLQKIEGDGGPLGNYYSAVRLLVTARSNPGFDPDENREQLDEAQDLLTRAKRSRGDWAAIPRLLGELHTLRQNHDLAYEYFDEAINHGDRSEYVVSRVVRHDLERNNHEKARRLLDRIAEERPRLLEGDLGRLAWQVSRSLEDESRTLTVLRSQAQRSGGAAEKILMAMDGIARGKPSIEAEQLLQEACESEPENPETWLSLVAYYTRFERTEDALDAIGKATSAESPATAAVTLARCYETLAGGAGDRSAEFLDQAKHWYQQALDANPGNSALRYAVAEFYRRHNEQAQAVRLLEQLGDPDSEISDDARTQTLITKALATAELGSRADSERALAMLRDADPLDDMWHARLLRAEATILDSRNGPGDAKALLRLLERIAELEPLTARERFLVAALHDSQFNDWETARAQYEQLAEEYPEDTAVLAALVNGLLRRAEDGDNLRDAQEYFEQLQARESESYRTLSIATRLAAADGGDVQAAATRLVEFVQHQLIEQPASELIQQIDENNIAEVSQRLSDVARAHSDKVALKILSAINRLAAEGNGKAAVTDLRKLGYAQWLTAEVRVELLRQTAELLERLEQLDLAGDLYRQYADQSARPEAVLAYARYLARQDRHHAGLTLCSQHWDEMPVQVVARAAIGLLRHGNLDDDDLLRIAPRLDAAIAATGSASEKAELLILMADLRDQQRRYDEVQDIFRMVLELNPDHIIALNNLAWLLARRGQPGESMALIEHAIDVAGPFPELLDTKGLVLTAAGKPTQAVEILTHAGENRPLAEIHLHMAEAHWAAGDRSASENALQSAENAGLDPTNLHPLDRAAYDELCDALGQP